MDCNKRRPREKVLILTGHGDTGPYIEVFAENITVHTRSVPYIGSRSGEALAEDFVAGTLKRPYRDLYVPGNLRYQGVIRKVLPSDIIDACKQRQLIRGLDTVAKRPKGRARRAG